MSQPNSQLLPRQQPQPRPRPRPQLHMYRGILPLITEKVQSSSPIPLLEIFDELIISHIFHDLITSQNYLGVIALMCTCHRMQQIGQPLLITEYHRLCAQPCDMITPGGEQHWHNCLGQLHRCFDLPASIYIGMGTYKRHEWYKNDQRHRDKDRPAMITAGVQYWFQHDQIHRDRDQPAVIFDTGLRIWQQHGKIHRDLDRPALIRPYGRRTIYEPLKDPITGTLWESSDEPRISTDQTINQEVQIWYQEGHISRAEDRPAIVAPNGIRFWYRYGLLHRDGNQPAVIGPNGIRYWYQQGKMTYWEDGQPYSP